MSINSLNQLDISSYSSRTSLEDMSDDELVDTVDYFRREAIIIETENQIIENFLFRIDPKLVAGLQAILDHALKIQGQLEQVSTTISQCTNTKSMASVSNVGSASKTSAGSPSSHDTSSGSNKRINLRTRLELLRKERETVQTEMVEFLQNSNRQRNNLRAELEEISMRISETHDARQIFEQSIVRDAVDALTQRIPAEKFIRYMEEWLKCADSTIEKLRLKSCTLRYKKKFLQTQLIQKEELGESLHPVDLEQLKIDHRVLIKKLEQKNIDLLDLKKKSGEANLNLNKNKRYLVDQIKILNSVTNEIKQKKIKGLSLLKEIDMVEKDVRISADKLNKLIKLNDLYTVPDTMQYIKQKSEIYQLSNSIKIWNRRNNLQQSALETCIKSMKRLTQTNIEDPAWFDPPQAKGEDDNINNKYYEIEDI